MHIPISPNRRPGTKAIMKSITIHNTANPKSNALGERNWLVSKDNKRTASWHIAIDDKQAIEAIPLDEVAWHAGNSVGNNSSIGIEVCESGNQKRTWDNAVALIAKLLHERNWDINRVTTHKAWSGKNCPRLLLPRWNEFIQAIKKELDKLTQPKPQPLSLWAKDAHAWVVAKKISDGSRPKDTVTREELWVMLHRASK